MSARAPYGSTIDPSASRRAIAFIVKSRRRRSSSTAAFASTTMSKSCRPGPVETSRRGGANSIPAGASFRTAGSRGENRTPTGRSATTSSSARPCGPSAERRPSMSTPGTRKSASLDSRPSSSSRTAPPTTYASRPSEPTYTSTALDEGNRLDLDERARGELRDLDGGPRRRRRPDVPCVDLVHAREVPQALQEDGGLHEPVQRASRLLEDRAQVLEHLLGLPGDVAAHQLRVAGLERELSRDEDEAVRLDRL